MVLGKLPGWARTPMLTSSKLWGIEKLVLLSVHFTLAGSLFAWRTDVDLESDKLQGATRKGRVAS
jgi:hypothetical protein